jgi:hypothetical protein
MNQMAVVLCLPYLPCIAPDYFIFHTMKLKHEENRFINVLEIPETSWEVLNSIMPEEFLTGFQW